MQSSLDHSDGELLETCNGENDDDIILNQAIQLSLNEANAGIMVEKSEEKTQKYWV